MSELTSGGEPGQEKWKTARAVDPVLDYQRPRRHWVIWLVVICMAGAIAFLVVQALRADQATATGRAAGAGRPVPVVGAMARVGSVPIYLNELGTVTPFNTVTVHTRVDGQLVKVAFDEGQIVHQGDLLAQIDPKPFEAQLEQAQGQLARDQALLANAQLDLKRYQDASDTVTQQVIDTQKALVTQSIGNVKSDQGQVDNAKVQLDYCTIIAPTTGRIGLRQVDQGNIVHASDANGLAVITQLQPISVVFSIVQDDIPRVMGRGGIVRALEVDAFDRAGNTWLAAGTVAAVDSQVDPTTAMVKLKATFENKDNALFPSQFVNVRLLVKTLQQVVIVPTDAVQRGPDGNSFVYVINGPSATAPSTQPAADPGPPTDAAKSGGGKGDRAAETVEVRNVVTNAEVDRQGADVAVIDSGLAVGEKVATTGLDKLQAGAKVFAKIVATSRPADAASRPSRGGGHGKGRGGHHDASSAPSVKDDQ